VLESARVGGSIHDKIIRNGSRNRVNVLENERGVHVVGMFLIGLIVQSVRLFVD